jgi:hypothetical protein
MIHDDTETFGEDLKKAAISNRHMLHSLLYLLDELVKEMDFSEEELRRILEDAHSKAAQDALDSYPNDLEQVGMLEKMKEMKAGELEL